MRILLCLSLRPFFFETARSLRHVAQSGRHCANAQVPTGSRRRFWRLAVFVRCQIRIVFTGKSLMRKVVRLACGMNRCQWMTRTKLVSEFRSHSRPPRAWPGESVTTIRMGDGDKWRG